MALAQTPSLPQAHVGTPAAHDAVRCPAAQDTQPTGTATAISLPSDVIDAIADALIAIDVGAAHATATSPSPLSPHASVQRLCSAANQTHRALALTADAQRILRMLAQVSRHWRQVLLHRAWRSVELTGSASPDAQTIHAFAGGCARRLAVPWGAMAAPVSWLTQAADSGKQLEFVGVSLDSARQPDRAHIDRLGAIFGTQVWPRVKHLDMSFMPLISYHGLAAHIQRTMPELATMRIGGYVPATALADILGSSLHLRSLEISASVWANSGGSVSTLRRSSASSWRSSASTVVPPAFGDADDADAAVASTSSDADGDHLEPRSSLDTLAVTGEALRAPPVLSFAINHAATLTTLHLLESDYKIMSMLRVGCVDERHQVSVEYGSSIMVLRRNTNTTSTTSTTNNGNNGNSMTVRSSMCWTALQSLHIHQYTMAPRENTRLCISARNMPALEELAIGRMEPCDNHHPAPTTMDASQVPQLRGRFAKLVRIKAPVFDIGSLRVNAPVLRYLNITGTGTGGGSSDTGASMLPTGNDIRSLVSAGIPLQRAVVCGQVVPLNE